ncbi:hypothetical protein [Glutamicibacter sp. FBE19]|uniref:hypothetical protein n=1 Tax=Glutamicibacter sp. FBE19 TaxID=2761534 RepID=UPI001896A50C|nr:hypothetical protein [Glutamicibacter sp. FBE19]MBF6671611.1 hypothetical protein [Glutamicibacter sp. FBE19]
MSNWTQLIPARIRTTLYVGFGVLSLAQSSVLAYSAAVQTPAPIWAVGAGAVLGVIGAAFGFVAAGNTDVTANKTVAVKLDASAVNARIDDVAAEYEGKHVAE